MVIDILYHSKERVLEKTKVRLSDFVRDLADTILPRLENTGVTLQLDLPKDRIDINIDKTSLFTAFLGVLENAVDACIAVTDKQKMGRIDFKADPDKDTVVFTITDNGKGLSKEQQDMIFSLFYSEKGSQGTGLGLFIAQKSIEQHSGTIQVHSKQGAFTQFIITLPLD